jgi:hypothetical protein
MAYTNIVVFSLISEILPNDGPPCVYLKSWTPSPVNLGILFRPFYLFSEAFSISCITSDFPWSLPTDQWAEKSSRP